MSLDTGNQHTLRKKNNMPYAEKTSVPVGRSKEQIEAMLLKVGVEKFAYLSEATNILLMFSYKGIPYRIHMDIPPHSTWKGSKKSRDQEIRRLWRVSWLVVKNRVVLIEEGAEPFQAAFLPYMAVGGNNTLYEKMQGALEDGRVHDALPAIPFYEP